MVTNEEFESSETIKNIAFPQSVVDIESVDHFNQLVHNYAQSIILVDFWATWCGPCRAFAPIFKELQHEYGQKGVIFAKLDVDALPEIAQQFGIQGVPTTLFIRNKKIIYSQVGMLPKTGFAQVLNKFLSK